MTSNHLNMNTTRHKRAMVLRVLKYQALALKAPKFIITIIKGPNQYLYKNLPACSRLDAAPPTTAKTAIRTFPPAAHQPTQSGLQAPPNYSQASRAPQMRTDESYSKIESKATYSKTSFKHDIAFRMGFVSIVQCACLSVHG